jgi:hypothetical protein
MAANYRVEKPLTAADVLFKARVLEVQGMPVNEDTLATVCACKAADVKPHIAALSIAGRISPVKS